ncbi:MAG TPA: protein kinase [Candidatus Polarisedimenticolia bacterium]|nr:protein kinase [Candidatus Polarisedimenticolia bacterium]
MNISTGARLGAYEIISPLGAGGMGQVYRARDTKLDREVAVKVLSARFSEDPEALARFQREAKAVAALSHPNILAIFDFGTADGVVFAVTELLDGETLRARLETGPLPPRKAANYALQIARGLAAAHEKGIVHRDLKPDNLFITRDGQLKILDFGLAKQSAVFGSSGDSGAQGATLLTEAGIVMGTTCYLSPEQVKGAAVDGRSDIFAFGSLLYEMITGQRAFSAGSPVETMGAILREEPPEVAAAGSLAVSLERIARHCLEKDPQERFQSARDLAFNLEALTSTLESGTSAHPIPAAAPPRRLTLLWAGLALAAIAASFEIGRRLADRPDTSSPVVSVAQLTDSPGVESSPRFFASGKAFVYVSNSTGNLDIHLLRTGGRNPINLTKDSLLADTAPSMSPEGDRIAFRSERDGGGVFIMGATGESVTRATDFGFDPSWAPDGKRLVVATEPVVDPLNRLTTSELWVVSIAGGEKQLLTKGDAVQPSWSPHGDRIAFWRQASGRRDVLTISAAGAGSDASVVAVTDDEAVDWGPVWSPDGRYLYFASDRQGTMNLWRVPIDEASGRTLGDPEPVTAPASWASDITPSRDGKSLLFMALDRRSNLRAVGFDPNREILDGSPRSILGGSRMFRNLDLSPDGQWLAFGSVGQREDLFVIKTDGTGYRQLTDDAFRDRAPEWSPDGQRILFYSNRAGPYALWTIHADGSGLKQIYKTSPNGHWYPQWSKDGARLAFSDKEDAWIAELNATADDATARELPRIEPTLAFLPWSFSPDGSKLAGAATLIATGGNAGLFTYDIASGAYQKLDAAGATPVWLSDGRRLLYARDGGIWLMDTASGKTHEVMKPAGEIPSGVSLSSDDRVMTFIETESEGDIWQMTLK